MKANTYAKRGQKIGKTLDHIREKVSKKMDRAKKVSGDKARTAIHTIRRKQAQQRRKAGSALEHAHRRTVDAAHSVAGSVKERAGHLLDQIKGTAHYVAGSVKKKTGKLMTQIKRKVHKAHGTVKEKAHHFVDKM